MPRDLTFKVFEKAVLTSDVLTPADQTGSFTEMFKVMRDKMNYVLKNATKETVDVGFDAGTFSVTHKDRSSRPYILMTLTEVAVVQLDMCLADSGDSTSVAQMLLMFFQVFSMLVYEVVVECMKPEVLDENGSIIKHIQETIQHMIIMLFLMIAPKAEKGNCKWRELFRELFKIFKTPLKATGKELDTFEQYTSLRRERNKDCVNNDEEKDLKRYANHILLLLGKGRISETASAWFGKMHGILNMGITKDALKQQRLLEEQTRLKQQSIENQRIVDNKLRQQNRLTKTLEERIEEDRVNNDAAGEDYIKLGDIMKEANEEYARGKTLYTIAAKSGNIPGEHKEDVKTAISRFKNALLGYAKVLPAKEIAMKRQQYRQDLYGDFPLYPSISENMDLIMKGRISRAEDKTNDSLIQDLISLAIKVSKEINIKYLVELDALLEARQTLLDRDPVDVTDDAFLTTYIPTVTWSTQTDVWTKHLVSTSTSVISPPPANMATPSGKKASIITYLQCAYIRSERFYRTYPIQVLIQFGTAYVAKNHTRIYQLLYTKHKLIKTVNDADADDNENLEVSSQHRWPVVCENALEAAKASTVVDMTKVYDIMAAYHAIFKYMALLSSAESASAYDSVSENTVNLNRKILPTKLRTVLFINRKTDIPNKRYTIETPQSSTSSYVEVIPFFAKVTYNAYAEQPVPQINGVKAADLRPKENCCMLIGPLAVNAQGDDFPAKMKDLKLAMMKQINDLSNTPMIIMGYGASGSGKTTCLYGLKEVDPVTKRVIELNGLLELITEELTKSKQCDKCFVEVEEFYVYDVTDADLDLQLKYIETMTGDEGDYTLLQDDILENLFRHKGPNKIRIKRFYFHKTVDMEKWMIDESKQQPYGDELNNNSSNVASNNGSIDSINALVHDISGRQHGGFDENNMEMMAILKDCVELKTLQHSGTSRKVSTTFLNPQSSRSHIIMEFKFTSSTTQSKPLKSLFIADFAGVENFPPCKDPETGYSYANLYRTFDEEGNGLQRAYNENQTQNMISQYGGVTGQKPSKPSVQVNIQKDYRPKKIGDVPWRPEYPKIQDIASMDKWDVSITGDVITVPKYSSPEKKGNRNDLCNPKLIFTDIDKQYTMDWQQRFPTRDEYKKGDLDSFDRCLKTLFETSVPKECLDAYNAEVEKTEYDPMTIERLHPNSDLADLRAKNKLAKTVHEDYPIFKTITLGQPPKLDDVAIKSIHVYNYNEKRTDLPLYTRVTKTSKKLIPTNMLQLIQRCFASELRASAVYKEDDFDASFSRFMASTNNHDFALTTGAWAERRIASSTRLNASNDPVSKGTRAIETWIAGDLKNHPEKYYEGSIDGGVVWLINALQMHLGSYAYECIVKFREVWNFCLESENEIVRNQGTTQEKDFEHETAAYLDAMTGDALVAASQRLKQVKLLHGQSICRFRVAEGRMINESLTIVRQKFAKAYGSQSLTATVSGVSQNKAQCEVLNNMHFSNNSHILNYNHQNATKFDVAERIALIIKPDEQGNQANAFILGVFNTDDTRDNPPKIDYIPCSELEQEYKRITRSGLKQACVDANCHVMKEVNFDDRVDVEVLKQYEDRVKASYEFAKSKGLDIKQLNEVSKLITNLNTKRMMIDNDKPLKRIIQSQTNSNSNTAIGTLEFMDQACKQFSTNQTFCFVADATLDMLHENKANIEISSVPASTQNVTAKTIIRSARPATATTQRARK